MNILVTGGAGYIGSHTCVELLKEKHEVIIVDNFSNSTERSIKGIESITGKEVKSYKADIRDENLLREVFKENKIDAVIHFAGLKAVAESCVKPLEYYDNNVYGSVALFKVMAEYGVKNVVFSSSATVYGENDVPYKEDMLANKAVNPYGKTKCMIEEILRDLYNSDNTWKIILLRYFNPVGAHESGIIGEDPKGIPNNLMPYICKVALGELPCLTVFGDCYKTKDGTCIRDYIHVMDLAQGHIKALRKLSSINKVEAYNLGTGCGYTVLDVIKMFEKASGQKINYQIGDRRDGDLPIVYASVEKAKKELDWEAKLGLFDMCKDAWSFCAKTKV